MTPRDAASSDADHPVALTDEVIARVRAKLAPARRWLGSGSQNTESIQPVAPRNDLNKNEVVRLGVVQPGA